MRRAAILAVVLGSILNVEPVQAARANFGREFARIIVSGKVTAVYSRRPTYTAPNGRKMTSRITDYIVEIKVDEVEMGADILAVCG